MVLAEENEVKEEELYDSVKPEKLREEDEYGQAQINEQDLNSEADLNATSKNKKRKTRG